MPPVSVLLHVPKYQSGEGLSFLSGDIDGDRDVEQVYLMSILFLPLSPKVCRVPRQKQPNWTGGAEGVPLVEVNALPPGHGVDWLLSLFKSLLETRPTPSICQTLSVLTWSFSSLLGNGSLTLGGEPLSVAYRGSLALQLL